MDLDQTQDGAEGQFLDGRDFNLPLDLEQPAHVRNIPRGLAGVDEELAAVPDRPRPIFYRFSSAEDSPRPRLPH